MAQNNSFHTWVNTVGVVAALVISGLSALFAYESNQAKAESLALVAVPVDTCPVRYSGDDEKGALGLCWDVTIANGSENRLSLVNYQIRSVGRSNQETNLPGSALETVDGEPLSLPMSLDGGEAKRIRVRSSVPIDGAVNSAIRQIMNPREQGKSSLAVPPNMRELSIALARLAHVDIAGNPLENIAEDDNTVRWTWQEPANYLRSIIRVQTGRGGWAAQWLVQPVSNSVTNVAR
ncbi:hypothetical protein [Burkholderia cepacia]|uniref:hypothetical protein n=1 Tax=Burkholderia cepacia TaxID=292 RepID=UPI000A6056FF|nr:hypothetical protein [Burkholderia cepacia]